MAAPKAIAALRAAGLLVPLLAASLLLPTRAARANGAFPDSLQILLPADRPQQIILATNFGLIFSDDDGATWTWTCEQMQTMNGFGYAVGPSPGDRLYSLSTLLGLAISDDGSCSWRLSGGAFAQALAKDYFPDPVDATRVLAIGATAGAQPTYALYASHDGGETFDAPFYTAPAGAALLGVESARSDPMTIYASMYTTTTTVPSIHPQLLRSTDGGQTFTTLDVEAALGPNKLRIVAVDPADPSTITLRVIGTDSNAENVAISHDGGQTFAEPVTVDNGSITAYAHLASGTILVGAVANADGVGFRSTDGGTTFQPWPGVPHLRALAERGGKLYAAPNNYSDGWAIGVSTDEGLTFTPLTTYDKVSGIRDCAKAACEDSCDFQAGSGIWPAAVCHPTTAGPPPTPPKSGCGCAVAAAVPGTTARRASGLGAAAALALALGAARRRRRR
jgi:hypothetical protein